MCKPRFRNLTAINCGRFAMYLYLPPHVSAESITRFVELVRAQLGILVCVVPDCRARLPCPNDAIRSMGNAAHAEGVGSGTQIFGHTDIWPRSCHTKTSEVAATQIAATRTGSTGLPRASRSASAGRQAGCPTCSCLCTLWLAKQDSGGTHILESSRTSAASGLPSATPSKRSSGPNQRRTARGDTFPPSSS